MPTDSNSDFFVLLESMSEASRKEVETACSETLHEPNEIIYEQGSVGDALYVVASGSVEALTFSPDKKQSRRVILMKAGNFFGELALFTDNPRLATMRACESTHLLKIQKEICLRLLKKIPELGYFFSQNLAGRLHGTSTEANHGIYAIDLSGNLQRFDLLTIVQAITGMGHTGELHLRSPSNQRLGVFFFRKGRVEHARFGHLLGVEAIWQGFVESAAEGTFDFKSVSEPSLPFPDEHKLDMESTSLLLEGVGKRDTYQAMPKTLREMDGRLTRLVPYLKWENAETTAHAKQIWNQLSEGPQPLLEVWKGVNLSAMTFLDIVMEMGMSGQAELMIADSEPPPPAKPVL